MRKRLAAFTRIELVVVLVVIGALVAMLLPPLGRGHPPGRRSVCGGNLEQIGRALAAYQVNYRDYMPYLEQADHPTVGGAEYFPTDSLAMLYPAFTQDSTELFACPSTEDRPEIFVYKTHTAPDTANGEEGGNYGRRVFGVDADGDGILDAGERADGRTATHSSYGYDDRIHVSRTGSGHAICADMDQQSTRDENWTWGNHKGGNNVLYKGGYVTWVTDVWASDNPEDNIFAPEGADWHADTDSTILRP